MMRARACVMTRCSDLFRELPARNGAPEGIRTPDPQIRSLVLYPAELPAPRVPVAQSRAQAKPAAAPARVCIPRIAARAGTRGGKEFRRVQWNEEVGGSPAGCAAGSPVARRRHDSAPNLP